MANKSILDKFSRIEMPDPTDLVLEQIESLIRTGDLKGGDRLPSDKKLEDKLCLSRGYITKAMKRLETFGIVYTVPQSGTYITEYGNEVLNGLVSNVIKLEEKDFDSLVDLRYRLELMAVFLVIDKADDKDLDVIEEASRSLASHLEKGDARYDHDILFHLSILKCAGNPVLQGIVTKLSVQTLDILNSYETSRGHGFVRARLLDAVIEHKEIFDSIKSRNKELAEKVLCKHFHNAKVSLSDDV